MMKQQKQEKAARNRVTAVYGRACHGVAIDIFDMSKVMKVGLDSVASGDDDAVLGQKIAAFVQTIRKN